MCDETREAAATPTRGEQAAREELRAILADSKAKRAVLRERTYAALRRMEQAAEAQRRAAR
jgi:hypothetical protein